MNDIERINSLIDTHAELYRYEEGGLIRKDRTQYMRHLIELELQELGHSLKGIPHLAGPYRTRASRTRS